VAMLESFLQSDNDEKSSRSPSGGDTDHQRSGRIRGAFRRIKAFIWRRRGPIHVESVESDDVTSVGAGDAQAGATDKVAPPVVISSGLDVSWSPIGLLNMLNAGGSIESVDVQQSAPSGSRRGIGTFIARGVGELGVFSTHLPQKVCIDGKRVPYDYNPANQLLTMTLEMGPGPDASSLDSHAISIHW
jgi:Raffinose synthase or seed imbibition protein Sip1